MIKLSLSLLLAASVWARAQAPAAPVLTYPGDMARNIPVSTSLKWKKVSGATGYHAQVAMEPGFAAPLVDDSTLVDTLASVKKLADSTTYYWRSRARNASGYGAWSKIRSFTTNPPLGSGPEIVAPELYSLGAALSPTLVWKTFPDAKSYGVQVSLATNFSTILFQDTAVKDTSLKITGLQKGTLYYWHVRANTAPVKTAWTKGNFTTLEDPPTAAAALLLPADGASDQPLTVEFSWEGVERASNYVLQVSAKADFSSIDKTDSASIPSILVDGLAPNTTYYWRVKGASVSGQGPFSAARSFKTGSGAAGVRRDRGVRAGASSLRAFAGSSGSARAEGRNGVTVEFTLADKAPVVLAAYGALGRERIVLAQGMMEAGPHRVQGLSGNRGAGIWWIELSAGDSRLVRRILLP
jgi:hypothetical protein